MLGNTLILIASVLACVLPAGTIVAWAVSALEWPGRRWVIRAGLVALFLPVLLQATSWDAAIGRQGWLGPWLGFAGVPALQGWTAVILLHSVTALPWVAGLIGLGMRELEPELLDQALLDGGPWSACWRTAVPRCRAWIAIAAAWTVVMVASDMTITDMYQVRTCAEVLYADFALEDSPAAVVVGALPSIVTVASIVGLLLIVAWRWRPTVGRGPRRESRLVAWGGWTCGATMLAFALILLGIPFGSLLVKAGTVALPGDAGWTRTWSAMHALRIVAGTGSEFRDEFFWTGTIATLAATITTIVAGAWAWWARRDTTRIGAAFFVLVLLASVPGPLLAVLVTLARAAFGGAWIDAIAERTVAFPVAYLCLRALPLALAIAWQAQRTLPRELLESLTLDGVGEFEQGWKVALPLRWRAMGAAWIVAACLSAGELAGTILLIPGRVSTVAVRMFQLVHAGVDDRLAGLCLVSTFVYALAAWIVWRGARTSRGAN